MLSFVTQHEAAAGVDGDVYQVCVANDMNHLVHKVVQIDIRSSVRDKDGREVSVMCPLEITCASSH